MQSHKQHKNTVSARIINIATFAVALGIASIIIALATSRGLQKEIQNMKEGKWQTTIGRSLKGNTLGIFGLGKQGLQVANFGKAFGMNVAIYDPYVSNGYEKTLGVTRFESLNDILKYSSKDNQWFLEFLALYSEQQDHQSLRPVKSPFLKPTWPTELVEKKLSGLRLLKTLLYQSLRYLGLVLAYCLEEHFWLNQYSTGLGWVSLV